MKDRLDRIVIREHSSVRDALSAIEQGAIHFALVVDADGRLVATVTDGDARRGFLRGIGLDAPVSSIMQRDPIVVHQEEGRGAALRLIRDRRILGVPVIDDHGRIVGLEMIDEFVGPPTNETWVVLMAGGLGVRLRPLTDTIPKPMLAIGGRPILETIIRNFSSQGFRKFYISVNYKREVIQEYFGDGSEFDVDIRYLIEGTPLGTAGALSLLPEQPQGPIIVMNGDLLTMVPFQNLTRFHEEHCADATLCVRQYISEVPFGVVQFEAERMVRIDEKPRHRHMVSAGIYVLNPSTLAPLSEVRHCDMPTLLQSLVDAGRNVCVFPIEERWLDIGRLDDLRRAEEEFGSIYTG